MYRVLCSLLLSLWLLTGCTTTPGVAPDLSSVQYESRLTQLLLTLSPDIPESEAARLARDVMAQSEALNRKFERTSPPWVHNFMVNTGIKKQGLCYHFSDGLYRYLIQRNYPHVTFHLVGAHIGEYWREHNALVITANGQDVNEGIIVDPWRETGRVFVSKLKEDRAYVWKHRPERGCERGR